MPEATLAIRPGEIRYVEIVCRYCGSPAVLPIDPPRSGVGNYASKRCLWCQADFPVDFQSAIENLMSGLRLLSREAPVRVRLVANQGDLAWRSRAPVHLSTEETTGVR